MRGPSPEGPSIFLEEAEIFEIFSSCEGRRPEFQRVPQAQAQEIHQGHSPRGRSSSPYTSDCVKLPLYLVSVLFSISAVNGKNFKN